MCKVSVPDFPSTRSEPSDLSYREWREIIVKNKVFSSVTLNVIIYLFVKDCSYSYNTQGLGFASCKDCRTVGTGKNSDFASYGTNVLSASSVNPQALVQDIGS